MSVSSSSAAGSESVTSRISFCVSYNGGAYFGWQSQKSGLPTIQKHLEEAISKVANHSVEIVCAGRTDKAVHASYQVIHFETTAKRSQRAWVFGCNANLPKDINVMWAGEVSESFHARFSAFRRRYHYVIYNHPIRPSHFVDGLTWYHYPLDEEKMHNAAQCLVGEHDFTSFRAVGCQSKSPFRHLDHVNVSRFENVVLIDIQGNAFLHHMVRNITGVLLAIGSGKQDVSWCQDVLEARDRTQADVTAPPYGLYLTHVDYPNEFSIPKSAGAPSVIQALLSISGHSPLQRAGSIDHDDMWDISFESR